MTGMNVVDNHVTGAVAVVHKENWTGKEVVDSFVDGNMYGTDVSISIVPNGTTISIEGNGYQNASEVDSSVMAVPYSFMEADLDIIDLIMIFAGIVEKLLLIGKKKK